MRNVDHRAAIDSPTQRDGAPVQALTVTVAMLSYRRPQHLPAALERVRAQIGDVDAALWDARVLIVDNDPDGGARPTVEAAAATEGPPIDYAHEPIPGIASARNHALDVAAARGDAILVFIDDDERPEPGWLRALLHAHRRFRGACISGPVRPIFDGELDAWVRAGGFFERRHLETGAELAAAATNNLLLDMSSIERFGLRFDPDFGLTGGSDELLTRELVALGIELRWCEEAAVLDLIPPERTRREWVIRRTFRIGNGATRVAIVTAGGPGARLLRRLREAGRGLVRSVAGIAQILLGMVTRSLRHRARGTRRLARGAGMLAAALGYRYVEYRRKAS